MTNKKQQNFKITEQMLIADILSLMPESADIFLAHGLGCIGCQFNAFETLKDGFLSHGFQEKDLQFLLDDLNEAVNDLQISPSFFDSSS